MHNVVTQVENKKKLEGAAVGYQAARRASQSKPIERKNRDSVSRPAVVSPRARANSNAIHEQKPTAPYRADQLLPPLKREHKKSNMKCLVLDLDETLVHSSFQPVDVFDFIVPVEIDSTVYQVYVAKRPGVDEFLLKLAKIYEIVVFTASLPKYADPVLDKLDIHGVVDWRLFRASCTCVQGTYVKDMGIMGRDLKKVIIIDNSPHSFAFNPENAIPCDSWFDDQEDRELFDLIPILEGLAEDSVTDVMEELERLQINGVYAVEQGVLGEEDSDSNEDNSDS